MPIKIAVADASMHWVPNIDFWVFSSYSSAFSVLTSSLPTNCQNFLQIHGPNLSGVVIDQVIPTTNSHSLKDMQALSTAKGAAKATKITASLCYTLMVKICTLMREMRVWISLRQKRQPMLSKTRAFPVGFQKEHS